MDACIGHEHTFALGFVATPNVVKPDGLFHRLTFEDRTVQRTYGLYVEIGSLLQHVLHLHTIFTADVEVIATRLASPVVRLVD